MDPMLPHDGVPYVVPHPAAAGTGQESIGVGNIDFHACFLWHVVKEHTFMFNESWKAHKIHL
jgi:hypothetical protein